MEYISLFEMFGTLGFPIGMTAVLMFYIKKVLTLHREEMNLHIERYIELQKKTLEDMLSSKLNISNVLIELTNSIKNIEKNIKGVKKNE
ncbi:MAG: hypothetical protein FWC41_00740 [Firmicutes bacterium]|nr:hypothetical protein [Bacillota bacterium]